MALWPRTRLERTVRKLITIPALIALGLSYGASAGYFAFSKATVHGLHLTWLVAIWIIIVLDIRARFSDGPEPRLKEPHPAFMLTILIVLTGAAGAFAALGGGSDTATYAPWLILAATILLAVLGFVLASKYKDRIGEARFTPPPDHE